MIIYHDKPLFPPLAGRRMTSSDSPADNTGRTRFALTEPPAASGAKVTDFTIVELLVVVSIIAILASMLLPALNKARNTTKRIACLNQERQVGTAIQFYVMDNNEHLPGYGINSKDRYLHRTACYLGVGNKRDAYEEDIFHCPLTDSSRYQDPNEYSIGCYGMNIWTLREDVPPYDFFVEGGPKLHAFANPSVKVLLGEMTKESPQGLSLRHDAPYPTNTQGAANNHGGALGACNYIYMDGHGKFESEWVGEAAFSK